MAESQEEQVGRKDKPIASENHAAALLSQQLRQTRLANSITLTAMAQQMDYSKTHVSWVEHGRHVPSRGFLAGYTNVVGLPVGPWLLARLDVVHCARVTEMHQSLERIVTPLPHTVAKSNDTTFMAQMQHLQSLLVAGTTEIAQHHPVEALDLLKEAAQATMILLEHMADAHRLREAHIREEERSHFVG